MDEVDWLASTDPQAMLTFLRASGEVSGRKGRLFAAACCRRIWHLMPFGPSRKAVEAAELHADGLISDAARDTASDAVYALVDPAVPDNLEMAGCAAALAAFWAIFGEV